MVQPAVGDATVAAVVAVAFVGGQERCLAVNWARAEIACDQKTVTCRWPIVAIPSHFPNNGQKLNQENVKLMANCIYIISHLFLGSPELTFDTKLAR